jgi:hypothetical protein
MKVAPAELSEEPRKCGNNQRRETGKTPVSPETHEREFIVRKQGTDFKKLMPARGSMAISCPL